MLLNLDTLQRMSSKSWAHNWSKDPFGFRGLVLHSKEWGRCVGLRSRWVIKKRLREGPTEEVSLLKRRPTFLLQLGTGGLQVWEAKSRGRKVWKCLVYLGVMIVCMGKSRLERGKKKKNGWKNYGCLATLNLRGCQRFSGIKTRTAICYLQKERIWNYILYLLYILCPWKERLPPLQVSASLKWPGQPGL